MFGRTAGGATAAGAARAAGAGAGALELPPPPPPPPLAQAYFRKMSSVRLEVRGTKQINMTQPHYLRSTTEATGYYGLEYMHTKQQNMRIAIICLQQTQRYKHLQDNACNNNRRV